MKIKPRIIYMSLNGKMSYDIEFGVRVYGTDHIERITYSDPPHPTYNVGQMIRACTGWDFNQCEWYKLTDVIFNIEKGIHEMRFNREAYNEYLPRNGWGSYNTVLTVLKTLEGILNTARELNDCRGEEGFNLIEHLYVRW